MSVSEHNISCGHHDNVAMATQGALQTRPPWKGLEVTASIEPPVLLPFDLIWEDSLTVLPVVSCSPPETPSCIILSIFEAVGIYGYQVGQINQF